MNSLIRAQIFLWAIHLLLVPIGCGKYLLDTFSWPTPLVVICVVSAFFIEVILYSMYFFVDEDASVDLAGGYIHIGIFILFGVVTLLLEMIGGIVTSLFQLESSAMQTLLWVYAAGAIPYFTFVILLSIELE